MPLQQGDPMKSQIMMPLLFVSFLLGSVPGQAQTKDQVLKALNHAHTQCTEQVKSVGGYGCLWNWKWHHGKCLLSPRKCNRLHLAETGKKGFTLEDYSETVAQLKEFNEITYASYLQKVEKSFSDPQKLLGDIHAYGTSCRNATKGLKDAHLKPLETLYKEIFGKQCSR